MSRQFSNYSNAIKRGVRSGINSFFYTHYNNRYLPINHLVSPKKSIRNDIRRVLGAIHAGKKQFEADLKNSNNG